MSNHNFIYPNNNSTYYGNAHTTHSTILHIHNSCILIKLHKIVILHETLLRHETLTLRLSEQIWLKKRSYDQELRNSHTSLNTFSTNPEYTRTCFQLVLLNPFLLSRGSSVGIPIGYGLDCRGSIPGRGNRVFSTLQPLDRL
jgi:hypothetical protein